MNEALATWYDVEDRIAEVSLGLTHRSLRDPYSLLLIEGELCSVTTACALCGDVKAGGVWRQIPNATHPSIRHAINVKARGQRANCPTCIAERLCSALPCLMCPTAADCVGKPHHRRTADND